MTSRNPEDIEQDIERTRSDMKSTLEAIEQKLAPQRLLEQAMDTVRDVVSPESALGRTVRDNPIPLALMGIGAVWMFIASTRKSQPAYGKSDDNYGEGYGYESSDYTSDYEAAAGVGGKVKAQAGRVMDRAKGTASRYADKASRYADSAQDYAINMQDKASDWARETKGQMGQLTDKASDIYNDYPIAIGIGAAMVGAFVGASMGRTRTEDELLGRHRDELVRQAEEGAHEALRRGEAMASRAVESARNAVEETISEGTTTPTEEKPGRVMH